MNMQELQSKYHNCATLSRKRVMNPSERSHFAINSRSLSHCSVFLLLQLHLLTLSDGRSSSFALSLKQNWKLPHTHLMMEKVFTLFYDFFYLSNIPCSWCTRRRRRKILPWMPCAHLSGLKQPFFLCVEAKSTRVRVSEWKIKEFNCWRKLSSSLDITHKKKTHSTTIHRAGVELWSCGNTYSQLTVKLN